MKISGEFVFLAVAVFSGCSAGPRLRTARPDDTEMHPHWILQNSGASASLRGISAVSQDVAWASGSDGTCLRTIDGGEHWHASTVPGAAELDFRDVHGVAANTAYLLAAGEDARILKTTDGGAHWETQYVNHRPGAFFDAFAFWDADHGLAFSDPVDGHLLIITTADGGTTWDDVDPVGIPPALPHEAGFAASGTCVVVHGDQEAWIGTGGPVARVFHSTDRGCTWTVATTPVLSGSSARGVFSLAFIDAQHGVAVGGDYQDPGWTVANAARTTDGGATWTLIGGAPPAGYRSAVARVPGVLPATLVAVGPSGSDYSTDGGQTWKRISALGFHAVDFAAPDGAGWAVGAAGRIARYAPAGLTPSGDVTQERAD
ncbi:MAG: oxidoreductase [Planctomycetes bacterium]|nr:oxidoreductase [Planctomycetota bacterium]